MDGAFAGALPHLRNSARGEVSGMQHSVPADVDKRRENLRLALGLALVAVAFFVGFMLKVWWMK